MAVLVDHAGRMLIGRYFALSYRILASPAGREFLGLAAAPGAPAVHGYATADDIEALIDDLRPIPADTVVDLGCGTGDVAIAVHRRTGCRVVGIDASRRAIAEAERRATAAQVSAAVRFEEGEVASTFVAATTAYALDALMFAGRPAHVLADVASRLDAPARVFATLVVRTSDDAFAKEIGAIGLRVERLDDVSASFAARSRARAAAARLTMRARPPRRGRFGLLLVLAEEAAVTWLIRHGGLRRWRLTVVRPAQVASASSTARTG